MNVGELIKRLTALSEAYGSDVPVTVDDADTGLAMDVTSTPYWPKQNLIVLRTNEYSAKHPYVNYSQLIGNTAAPDADADADADSESNQGVQSTPVIVDVPPPSCSHSAVTPKMTREEEKEAHALRPHEVRKRWPRFQGICPECNQQVIAYASMAHYILGDW